MLKMLNLHILYIFLFYFLLDHDKYPDGWVEMSDLSSDKSSFIIYICYVVERTIYFLIKTKISFSLKMISLLSK